MKTVHVSAYKVEIYIAGDLFKAQRLCQKYCTEVGLCVTVTPTMYAYTGDMEAGVIVGLINYGRFPKNHSEIYDRGVDLGLYLMEHLNQQSFTIQDAEGSTWYSNRPEDNKQ